MNQLLEFSSDLIELLIVDCMQKFYLILIVVFLNLKIKNIVVDTFFIFLIERQRKAYENTINDS